VVDNSKADQAPSPLFELENSLGVHWPNIRAARQETEGKLAALARAVQGKPSADSVVVVNGSLARMECTQGSDLDWLLLVDGQADVQNQATLLEIERKLGVVESLKGPGREGTFGKLIFSQPIMHQIGGEEDSNSNTTRRILLLLESLPVGERNGAFLRVRTGISDATSMRTADFFSATTKEGSVGFRCFC